ncbi:MAG: flagellar hook-basal body complex protein FliE [Candidatus Eremiobacteraeota bacterium]|nr:flagellar hook-basal body complex protein FliE [Candidatus Eremiobacteraeota bacterium]
MRVEPLVPDAPSPVRTAGNDGAATFARLLDALGSTLATAQSAEDAFARNRGSLQDAMYERARADVVLAIATAAAGRTAQALTAIMNMQV